MYMNVFMHIIRTILNTLKLQIIMQICTGTKTINITGRKVNYFRIILEFKIKVSGEERR